MEFIQVDNDRIGFKEKGTGKRFTPFGCNYFDPATGWAPHLWQRFSPERTERHFAQMEDLGVNTARVFLTIASFMTESGELSRAGMEKADRMVAIARKRGIRVEFAGPDHWEGVPDWAKRHFDEEANAYFLDGEWVHRLKEFWRQFARHYRDEPAVFSFDLLNEPWLKWDSQLVRRIWGGPPPEEHSDETGDDAFVIWREQVVWEWTKELLSSIREEDPNRLVTIGFHQLSLPHDPGSGHAIPGFHAKKLSPLLDYVAMHWYPYSTQDHVRPHRADDPTDRNIDIIRASIQHAYSGKPIVIEEFGWYGGDRVFSWGEQLPFVSEEVQTQWCRKVVERTRDLASGWLTWGYSDVPTAMDVTRKSGLVDEHGKIKRWGHAFRELAASEPAAAPS